MIRLPQLTLDERRIMVETIYHVNTPVSIALLGDLHNRPFGAVTASLRNHRPDMIAVAGDVVYGSQPEGETSPLEVQHNVLPFLSSCAEIAPTFLSLGNHEWMLDAKDLTKIKRAGVILLDNDFFHTSINGKKLVIGGLTSGYVLNYRRFRNELSKEDKSITITPPLPRYPHKTPAGELLPDTSWLPRFCEQDGFLILLTHHPEYWKSINHYPVNLFLSAHAHGGQWRYWSPGKRHWEGVYAPGQGIFPRFTKGICENMIVTAGLGNTTWIPRFFNPTEVVYIKPPAGR